jgi:hypothetical protein
MSRHIQQAAWGALAAFACACIPAIAQDHAYSEGPVVNVSRIRTVDGKQDEYLHWLDTTWKQEQEAAKRRGYITDYRVYLATPYGPEDPDVYLVITYPNWAAFDGSLAKGDVVAKEVEGSVAASNQSEFDRAKIRRVLGSETIQEAVLK